MEKEGQLSRPGYQSTKGNDLWEKGNKTSEPCRSPSLLPERDSRPRCVGAGETQVDFLRWVNGVNSPGSPRQLESVRKSTSAKYLERLHWFKRQIFISYQKIKALIVQKKKKKNRDRIPGDSFPESEFREEYWSVQVCEAVTQGIGGGGIPKGCFQLEPLKNFMIPRHWEST